MILKLIKIFGPLILILFIISFLLDHIDVILDFLSPVLKILIAIIIFIVVVIFPIYYYTVNIFNSSAIAGFGYIMLTSIISMVLFHEVVGGLVFIYGFTVYPYLRIKLKDKYNKEKGGNQNAKKY